jgi:hypothetical protein
VHIVVVGYFSGFICGLTQDCVSLTPVIFWIISVCFFGGVDFIVAVGVLSYKYSDEIFCGFKMERFFNPVHPDTSFGGVRRSNQKTSLFQD